MVPLSKKESWWTSFVQKYYWDPEHHDMVLHCWEVMCKESIRNLVSKRRRNGIKPDYIGLADWNIMLDAWDEEPAKKMSKINANNRKSDPDGLGIHRHISGAKKNTRVAYEMALEAGGILIAPPATEVVRKTHIRKDGTFIDKRAESFVLAAQNLATQRSSGSNVNSHTGSTTAGPSNQQLTAAYIEMATNNKRRIYGLGSIQYINVDPNESVAASLQRNLDVDMRLTKIEGTMNEMKKALNAIIRLNEVDPVTHQPRNQPPRVEGASSVASPCTRSHSVLGPTQEPAQQFNQTSPFTLAGVTPQSVEGFEFEKHH